MSQTERQNKKTVKNYLKRIVFSHIVITLIATCRNSPFVFIIYSTLLMSSHLPRLYVIKLKSFRFKRDGFFFWRMPVARND